MWNGLLLHRSSCSLPNMMRRSRTWLTLAGILLALAARSPLVPAQCVSHDDVPHMERFSAIENVAGLSGPSGIELILTEKNARVTGVLRDYEGLPNPVVTKLKGTLRNCEVDLSGSNRRGRVEIHGEIMIATFRCVITRHIAGKTYSETVSLRREPPESYDTARFECGFSAIFARTELPLRRPRIFIR